MANNLYDEFRKSVAGNQTHSQPVFGTDNFKVILLDAADHATSLSADVAHADLTALGIVATSGNLATVTGTVATNVLTVDSADVTIATVSGDQFEELVLYKDSGVSATSPLIANYDTGTGLPFTPSGGNITVAPAGTGWFFL